MFKVFFNNNKKKQSNVRCFHKMSSAVECQVCNEILSNKDNLKTHQKLKHLHNVMSLLCEKRLERSNYKVKNVESESHGRKLFKCVLHLNAYNI